MANIVMFTSRMSRIFFKKSFEANRLVLNGKKNHVSYLCEYFPVSRTFSVASSLNNSESDSDEESVTPKEITDLKLQILKAGLNFVPEHGWTKKSLAYGAESLGLSTASHGLIVDGGVDLVHFFNIHSNEKLEQYLQEKYCNKPMTDLSSYLEDALQMRLKMVIPVAPKWSEAMALLVNPVQFPVASKNLLDMVDIVWNSSGDKSLDMTWYSKRISLALMYKACELSLVQDKSPEYIDTFEFLQRRIETVLDCNNAMDQVSKTSEQLPDLGVGAIIIMRNILGANSLFR